MTRLLVRRLAPEEPDAVSLFESMDSLFQAIRERAFGRFEDRDRQPGAEIEDWLQAEGELVWIPQSEVLEEEKQFRLRLAVPGLEATELQITAMPDSIIVQAEAVPKEGAEAVPKEGAEAKTVPFSEFRQKKLFRRFDLSEPIDPERTEASLAKGILEIVAGKAAPARQVKVAVQGT
jgi:HSP20 family molecular chaperone IbpA